MKLAMIIDKKRCYGCNGCTVACKQANATPPGSFYTKVLMQEQGTYPNAKQVYMPLICMHCDDAPCVEVCPTGASQKISDGTVQINNDECIGCMSCMEVCPYDARYFNEETAPTYWQGEKQTEYEKARSGEHEEGKVNKCTFCAPRREKGIPPACVETCPAVARIFGDLDDPKSEISIAFKKHNPKPYKPEEGTKPRVFYIE